MMLLFCVLRVNRWKDMIKVFVCTEGEQMEECDDTAFVY